MIDKIEGKGEKTLRIALCDDEQKILDEVSLYIKQYAEKTGRNIESVCFSRP